MAGIAGFEPTSDGVKVRYNHWNCAISRFYNACKIVKNHTNGVIIVQQKIPRQSLFAPPGDNCLLNLL